MPAVFPINPSVATQDASFPLPGFLKIQAKIYKTPANPYTNVTMDNMFELLIVSLFGRLNETQFNGSA
jgi:hypothetical protein